ncbi:hypothetical protein AMK59_887 [Oryctes borbonicus]|uniref:Dynactin subunit 3 n=1 Tax=Oryctes borbonicus TaxID=1629725 RepID=A0A0T6BA47_9SCAR|nr:hypothetical protein AMK59_887 [Oryctes borbonicus]
MSDPIDLLEKRIAALELQILPKEKDVEINKVQPIADLLIQTHTMIATALSCRDAISAILEKLPVINEYLNPMYSETELELEAKRQYVLELYPELKETAVLLTEFDSVRDVTDSKVIARVSDLAEKLETMVHLTLDTYDECKSITKKVLESLQQYSDIIKTIKILFAQLEYNITEIEAILAPKPPSDD